MTQICRWLAVALLLVCCLHPCSAQDDHYWDWGVGCYYGGLGDREEIDIAMYDWLYLCFGNVSANTETVEQINRYLALNPDLKIVIRVWPIMSQGDCEQNRYQATFLHYLYKDGVRDGVLKNIRDQIAVVMDNISKPENVVGLTFLEELPGHFSAAPFMRSYAESELPWDLERFKAEIEAERGKPLVWDIETREWWGRKWCEVLGEIHAEMKKASGGKLVFYYQQTNHSFLDIVPEGTPLDKRGLIPIHWGAIIKPGLCDGFFAYPNSAEIWDRYLKLARDNNWLLFSQVSHPPFMRLCAWEECISLARTKDPRNLGYFLYCEGDCGVSRAWNADKTLPRTAEWSTRGVSVKYHIRRHLAEQGVGREVLARHPYLSLQMDLPLEKATTAEYIHPRVIVRNTREESYSLDPEQAVARDVKVTIQPPEGFTIDRSVSPPATLGVGDLAPGESVVCDWWVGVPAGFSGELKQPFVVSGACTDAATASIRVSEDAAIPCGLVHEIGGFGAQWLEPGFRLSSAQLSPAIEIEPLKVAIRNPRIGDEFNTIQYRDTLEPASRLIVDPMRGARLFYEPLCDDAGEARVDANDPTGFKAFADGYMVSRSAAGGAVRPGEQLTISAFGKAEGGGQSLIVMRYTTAEGQKDESVLVNRFSAEWKTVSQTVTVPEGAVSLQNVFLYRFKQEGTVWYGAVRVERTGMTEEGIDVSDRVAGRYLTLWASGARLFSYSDDNEPTMAPRVRVRVVVPHAE